MIDKPAHNIEIVELPEQELEAATGGAPDPSPRETITFNYGRVEWVYTPQKR